MKKNTYDNTGTVSAEDRALNTFAELMIAKISNLQQDWKKPWFTPETAQLPRNLNGRQYNGMNCIVLMLMQEKQGWQTSRYATFERIAGLNFTKDKDGRKAAVDGNGDRLPRVSINKGEKSTPVMVTTFTCVNTETKEHIKYDDYRKLSPEEQKAYHVYPKLQVYNVFNIDQTNMKEARPEMYRKFQGETAEEEQRTAEGMVDFPAMDAMIEKDLYVCPIKPMHGDNAYYSISRDEIVVPEKSQFIDGEAFYTNLLHEMSHASGAASRLNRLVPDSTFGSKEYAREELVAELPAALVSSRYGMSKHIKSDSAAYLKSWLESLHEDPAFIKTTLMDVKRSSSFIGQRIDAVSQRLERDGWDADYSDIREKNKAYTPVFGNKAATPVTLTVSNEEVQVEEQQSKPKEQQEEVAAKSVSQPRFHR